MGREAWAGPDSTIDTTSPITADGRRDVLLTAADLPGASESSLSGAMVETGQPPVRTTAAGARPLRLLSYNIQAGIATNTYHHYLTHSWKHVLPYAQRLENLDNIARLITEFDVVGLQEVDAGSLRSGYINQIEYLADRASFPCWYHQSTRRLGRFTHHSNGVLSRFRPTLLDEHKLPGVIRGRGVLWVQYGTGKDALVILILHLALGRRTRLRQLGYIADLVTDYRNVVMMGDLNCLSSSREIELLRKRAGLSEPTHGLHTFPSWSPSRNIDHILVSPSLHVERISVLNYALSDHLPIAMEVALPAGIRLVSG